MTTETNSQTPEPWLLATSGALQPGTAEIAGRRTPLDGITVIDLSRVLAGPYCTMILGDLGAEVIKIEQPDTGDETRGWGPPFAPNSGDSAYFMAVNRNKCSLTLDLKKEEGKDLLRRLLAGADVLVENFRVGTLERLGFGFEVVAALNPRLVYCSITGFGRTGPHASRGGYDVIAQGLYGIMSVTGEPDGPPVKVGVPIVDVTAGMFAVQGILAALLARTRTGRGQLVDTSLLEAELAWLVNVASNYLISGQPPPRLGNAHPNIAPYEPYRAADGYVIVGVGNERLWNTFCRVIGMADLLEDPRFLTNSQRLQHREALNALLAPCFGRRTAAEWTDVLVEAGIPAGPIRGLDQVFADPQVRAREMLVEVQHPQAGPLPLVGMPVKFSETPGCIRLPPPLLGQHTEEILRRCLGLTDPEIAALRDKGVV